MPIGKNMKTILEIRSLSKLFQDRANKVYALNDISCSIYEEEIIALLGVNGAGKTTLASILSGLQRPTSGDILYKGISIGSAMNEYKKNFGLCQQKPNLDQDLTIYENLLFAGRYYLIPEEVILQRIQKLFDRLHLQEYKNFYPDQLSGGYKQRVMIARALIHEPRIVLLDEPTVGLDPHVRRQLWDILRSLKEEGITIILTTHYLDEAEALADRVMILDKGKILLIDKTENLKRSYQKSSLEDVFLHLMQEEAL